MKRGFTLLELIVVIIILGVLATLATTQYSKMIEKSRGAEARIILGSIRTNAAAYYMSNNYNCAGINGTPTLVGVGDDYPTSCANTHYFSYSLTASDATGFTALATRCTANSKSPDADTASTIQLQTDFSTGQDDWTYAIPY